LDLVLHRVFVDPQGYYYRGPGGIDWMEKTLAQLAEILAIVPSHRSAIELREQIEARLPRTARDPEEMLTVAETRFAAGDLVGCIQCLAYSARSLRKHEAAELRQRVRQKIHEGVSTAGSSETAQKLATDLFRDVDGFYLEGLGGIDWAESIMAGLEEILYLWPE